MHAIDADAHVANKFSEGDPSVPRAPTQVDHHWLNAIQEELLNLLTLAAVTPVKGTWTQIKSALDLLFVKLTGNQNVSGTKTFTDAQGLFTGVVLGASGSAFSGNLTFDAALLADFQAASQVQMNNDFSASNVSNQFSARAVHKAHASIVLNNSASPTVDADDSFNINAVSVSSSILAVSCGSNFFALGAKANATVTLGDELGATLYHARIVTHDRGGVTIKIRDNAGALADAAGAALNGLRVYVHLEGKQ